MSPSPHHNNPTAGSLVPAYFSVFSAKTMRGTSVLCMPQGPKSKQWRPRDGRGLMQTLSVIGHSMLPFHRHNTHGGVVYTPWVQNKQTNKKFKTFLLSALFHSQVICILSVVPLEVQLQSEEKKNQGLSVIWLLALSSILLSSLNVSKALFVFSFNG